MDISDEIMEKTSLDNSDSVDNNSSLLMGSEVSDIQSWESLEEVKDTNAQENKVETSEWEDVLGSGALMKKTIKEGQPDTKPKRQMICTINYTCTLSNGEFVEKFENLKVQQGDLDVIQAIDLVLALMNVGEKCLLKVEPRFAYGMKGNPPNIMPNSVLHYEMELVDVEEDREDLSIAERKKIGNDKKVRGNWWYGRGEYTFAIQCYRRALDYLDEAEGGITYPAGDDKEEVTDSDLQALLEDRLSVHNNMAAAQLKQGAHDAALNSLQNVLRCQPNNIKALYRKAMVLKEKNDIPEALRILQKAKSIEPDNTSVTKEIKALNGIIQKHKNFEKELAKRMFNNSEADSVHKIKDKRKSSPWMWASLLGSIAVGIVGVTAWRLKFT